MKTQFFSKDNILTWLIVFTGAFITVNAIIVGSKIFGIPFILLGLWGWIQLATKRPAIALIIIVFWVENCFGVFTFGIRSRLLSDIGIALMLPLIILNLWSVWNHITKERTLYDIGILIFFIIIINSLYWGSYLTFGQPMSIGLTVARKYLLFLSYFFMVAVGASREDCYKFMKYLAWIGVSLAFLSIIEVVLGGGVIFKYAHGVGLKRAGMLRVHVGEFLIAYSIIYSFIKYQSLKKTNQKRLWHVGVIGIGLFTLVFIVMTRAIILGLLITFTIWFLRKISSTRIMFLCGTISIAIFMILSGAGDSILNKTFIGEIVNQTITELGSDNGNISIRKEGATYYLNFMWDKAPLTGVGRFSGLSYPNNPLTKAGEMYHYRIIDNNGIATVIYFGIIGLLLLVFFVVKSLIDSFCLTKNSVIDSKAYHFEIVFFIFVYTLATPTLNNIIVERMLIYTGFFFYLLSNKAQTKPIAIATNKKI